MKINFVLPDNSNHPIGGYKIIYQYANMFAAAGNDVTISYTLYDRVPYMGIRALLGKIKRYLFFYFKKDQMLKKEKVTWFDLDPKIKLKVILPYKRFFAESDIVVATAWTTAYTINLLNLAKGEKVYFIQHDERVFANDKLVRPTWTFNLNKIVIASWLQELLKNEVGEKSFLVKNFVNNKEFCLTTDLYNRKHVISMLNHGNPSKGTKGGIEVLKRVHAIIPDLKVELFGIPEIPKDLPEFFSYTRNATICDLNEIYNKSSIYLFPSQLEGWGLTATEAMMCGAALVSFRNGGVQDFGIQNKTALLSDVNDYDGLAENIVCLLNDNELRVKMAKNGRRLVQNLTINKSFKQLDLIFNQISSHNIVKKGKK